MNWTQLRAAAEADTIWK